jgi:hypothetical protein
MISLETFSKYESNDIFLIYISFVVSKIGGQSFY